MLQITTQTPFYATRYTIYSGGRHYTTLGATKTAVFRSFTYTEHAANPWFILQVLSLFLHLFLYCPRVDKTAGTSPVLRHY